MLKREDPQQDGEGIARAFPAARKVGAEIAQNRREYVRTSWESAMVTVPPIGLFVRTSATVLLPWPFTLMGSVRER
jgi:hypothetical protein